MNKKNLSLSVLKALEPFVGLQGKFFTIEEPGNNLLSAKDKDPNSKFYYLISKNEIQDGRDVYTVVFAPKNEKEVKDYAMKVYAENLTENFNSWVNLLENYNQVKSFFDDPILETFQAEFISNFEFLDDSAETNPFQTTQILQLDDLLERMSTRLIELSDDNNTEEIHAIAAEIVEIRENLASRSKKWVVEHISNVYAKIAKQGTKFIKEFWAEASKEFVKNVVKGLIEAGTDLIN